MTSWAWGSSQRGLVEAPESLRPLRWTAEAFCLRRGLILNAQPPCQALLHQWQPCVWLPLRALHKCREYCLHAVKIHAVCMVADFLIVFTYLRRLYRALLDKHWEKIGKADLINIQAPGAHWAAVTSTQQRPFQGRRSGCHMGPRIVMRSFTVRGYWRCSSGCTVRSRAALLLLCKASQTVRPETKHSCAVSRGPRTTALGHVI